MVNYMHEPEVDSSLVREALHEHDLRMAALSREFRAHRALWETAYWQSRPDGSVLSDRYTDVSDNGMIRVEVNRIHGYVTGFLGQLFSDDVKVKYGPSYSGDGNAVLTTNVINRVLHSVEMSKRITDCMRQGIIYRGAGIKVWVDHDPRIKNPLARVRASVVPWPELVLDRHVRDVGDARFYGHVYMEPSARVRRRFKIAGKLVTTTRPDVFADEKERGTDIRREPGMPYTHGNPLNQNFVRVLEVYNLVDDYVVGEADPLTGVPYQTWEPVLDEHGHETRVRGRMEIYLPDEPGGFDRPLRVYPLPFDHPDGYTPIPCVLPLILEYVPEYPLQGLSMVGRVYDQFRELILERTWKANAVKKNARQFFAKKNKLDDTAKAIYQAGEDGAIIEVELEAGESLSSVVFPLQMPNINTENAYYTREISEDIDRGTSLPPFVAGQMSGASATEVNFAASYAKNYIGLLSKQRDLFLEKLEVLLRAAIVSALRACGPDAVIKVPYRDTILTVKREDIEADFPVEIKSPAASSVEEDRERQTFVTVVGFLKPVIDAVVQGDEVAAMILDHAVDLFKLPREFTSAAIRKIAKASEPPPPPPEDDAADIERQPGAGSALPGGGSVASLPEGGGGVRMAGDMPMPEGPVPEDVQTGLAQNGAPVA